MPVTFQIDGNAGIVRTRCTGLVTFAEVIDTYVFKYGLQQFQFSYGAAVGLLKSVVALILVVSANAVMKRATDTGVF